MNGIDEKWRRVEEIFRDVVELAPEKRSAFLDAACAGDAPLRQEVESLLAHEKEDGTTFAPGETADLKSMDVQAERAALLMTRLSKEARPKS